MWRSWGLGYSKIFNFLYILKITFHLQLLKNTGYIPHVLWYILESVLYPTTCISHSHAPIGPLSPLSTSKVKWSGSHSVMSDSLQPWNSPGQNTGVGSLPLFQGIFPTQGSNPGLILYQLSHKRSSRILEWVAYPFFSGFPDPGINWGLPHCRGFFTTELSGKPPLVTLACSLYLWVSFSYIQFSSVA